MSQLHRNYSGVKCPNCSSLDTVHVALYNELADVIESEYWECRNCGYIWDTDTDEETRERRYD